MAIFCKNDLCEGFPGAKVRPNNDIIIVSCNFGIMRVILIKPFMFHVVFPNLISISGCYFGFACLMFSLRSQIVSFFYWETFNVVTEFELTQIVLSKRRKIQNSYNPSHLYISLYFCISQIIHNSVT